MRLTALFLGLALALPGDARGDDARLVLLVVVDQLRRDRLTSDLPGGLGRLVREGRVYREGVLDHAITATCPGHTSIATGHHPGRAGVPGNSHIDRETGESVYCVEDSPESAAVLGVADPEGRSPALLRVDGLGDWLKDSRPGSKAFGVSGKDRSAISMAGRRGDGAWWFEPGTGFTTSRHYRPELPDWVREFNTGLASRVPEQWRHGQPSTARPDDFRGESPDFERHSPHPLRDESDAVFGNNLRFTPYLDELTLAFAQDLARRERLGEDDAPDLLAIGLSATDYIGHLYGPESAESVEALRALDRAFGAFWSALEARVGAGRVLVALSADHGVLPLPEWLAESGRSECPVGGGRAGLRRLALGLTWELHKSFGNWLWLPDEWFTFSGAGLFVRREVAARREVAVDEVLAAIRAYLEEHEAIRRTWSEADLREPDSEFARLYRNSWDPERMGDLVVQVEPTCLISPFDHGTSHGSPYLYDRAVPIAFHGAGIPAGVLGGRARTIDIAPTLARQIGVAAPAGVDGEPLF